MTSPAPSGRQVVICRDGHAATVVEVGGGLRTYQVGDTAILDGYGDAEMCPAGRGQALLPWPNRIDAGRYEFDGVPQQLALTEPAAGNAIHGLTRFAPWTVEDVGDAHVRVAHRLHPQPGYPFTLDLAIEYLLDGIGLRVVMRATNVGSARCPFGAGAHPYITVGPGATLRCPAAAYLERGDRGIPGARRSVAGTGYDFRDGRPVADARLDTAFTELGGDGDGRWATTVGRATVWAGPAFPWLMLYTPEDGAGVAVEPMTCPPNAFRSGQDVVVLDPGSTFEGEWGITPG